MYSIGPAICAARRARSPAPPLIWAGRRGDQSALARRRTRFPPTTWAAPLPSCPRRCRSDSGNGVKGRVLAERGERGIQASYPHKRLDLVPRYTKGQPGQPHDRTTKSPTSSHRCLRRAGPRHWLGWSSGRWLSRWRRYRVFASGIPLPARLASRARRPSDVIWPADRHAAGRFTYHSSAAVCAFATCSGRGAVIVDN